MPLISAYSNLMKRDFSPILRAMKGHTFGAYPEVDMHALPYPDETFDIVVHSDTLEHVPEPVHALGECKRVLKPNGALCFTVPIIVARLSRSKPCCQKAITAILRWSQRTLLFERNSEPTPGHGRCRPVSQKCAFTPSIFRQHWQWPLIDGLTGVHRKNSECPVSARLPDWTYTGMVSCDPKTPYQKSRVQKRKTSFE